MPVVLESRDIQTPSIWEIRKPTFGSIDTAILYSVGHSHESHEPRPAQLLWNKREVFFNRIYYEKKRSKITDIRCHSGDRGNNMRVYCNFTVAQNFNN